MPANPKSLRYNRTYRIWLGMKSRCFNKNKREYRYYGGRGITICDRWLKFENFYADMGDCPNAKSIERINNDGNYCPENCAWKSHREQCLNRRYAKRKFPRGVDAYLSKFVARINAKGKKRHLGVFPDIESASRAFEFARKIVLAGIRARL